MDVWVSECVSECVCVSIITTKDSRKSAHFSQKFCFNLFTRVTHTTDIYYTETCMYVYIYLDHKNYLFIRSALITHSRHLILSNVCMFVCCTHIHFFRIFAWFRLILCPCLALWFVCVLFVLICMCVCVCVSVVCRARCAVNLNVERKFIIFFVTLNSLKRWKKEKSSMTMQWWWQLHAVHTA